MYENAPIYAYGSFSLYNLTIKMTLDNAGDWFPTFETWPTDYSGYALHIEGDNIDPSKAAIAIIKNCIFYSESNCAVGLGLHNNQTVKFVKCEFYRVSKNDAFRANQNYRGAFVAHCSSVATDINQVLIMKSNYFQSDYGYAGNILGSLEGSQGMSILAVSNIFSSDELGTDCFLYDAGQTTLLQGSKNNSANCLNIQ